MAHFSPDVIDGEVRGFSVFVYDVTAQRQAQEKLSVVLRDHEALLRAVQENEKQLTQSNKRIAIGGAGPGSSAVPVGQAHLG